MNLLKTAFSYTNRMHGVSIRGGVALLAVIEDNIRTNVTRQLELAWTGAGDTVVTHLPVGKISAKH